MPKPEIDIRDKAGKVGIIYFGATRPAVLEAQDELQRGRLSPQLDAAQGVPVRRRRSRTSAPQHDTIFVIEQNRDAQMRSLLMTEADVPGTKLIATLNYDGIAAHRRVGAPTILKHIAPAKAAAAE